MEDKPHVRAQGYRVPKVDVKDLILSLVALGFRRPKRLEEAAKAYIYLVDEEGIHISQTDLNGNVQTVGFKPFAADGDRERVLKKGKFKEGAYVYYLDKETVC